MRRDFVAARSARITVLAGFVETLQTPPLADDERSPTGPDGAAGPPHATAGTKTC